jgi:MarR family transcriptional regulator, transcriptional regulator for hemolysin
MARRDLESHVAFLLYDAAKHLRLAIASRVEAFGLTPAMWRCLAYLELHGGSSLKALAEALEVQSMSVVRIVDELEKRGLVRRAAEPRDRRALQLHLTKAAEPVLERIWRVVDELIADAQGGMSAKDLAVLVQSLRSIRGALQKRAQHDLRAAPVPARRRKAAGP